TCHTNKEPCRSVFTYVYYNGTSESAPLDSCSCQSRQCHTAWRRPNYMIRVRMFSDVSYMTANFMFCERLYSNLPTCQQGSIGLVMKGTFYPEQLHSIACKCPDSSTPLFYKRSYHGDDHMQYFEYICDSHKAFCTGVDSQCVSTSNGENRYHCECPSDLTCKVDPDRIGRCQ
ncbi:hypothetical protein Bpfe_004926, partial [Biomphalaria pfeifferi]